MATKKTGGPSKTSAKNGGVTSFPVVAIGASAGGLEALESFFDHMPSGSGMAFVVIQHPAPQSKSMLQEMRSSADLRKNMLYDLLSTSIDT